MRAPRIRTIPSRATAQCSVSNERSTRWRSSPLAPVRCRDAHAGEDRCRQFFRQRRRHLISAQQSAAGQAGLCGHQRCGQGAAHSTVGPAWLFDIASRRACRTDDEDFGQTLGVWGWARAPISSALLRSADSAGRAVLPIDMAGDDVGRSIALPRATRSPACGSFHTVRHFAWTGTLSGRHARQICLVRDFYLQQRRYRV